MKKLFSIIILTTLTIGCQRQIELATVQSDLLFPIAYGSLGLENYLNEENVNQASDTLVFEVNDTILSLGLSDLVGIPDTTLVNEFEIPFAGASFPPGVPFHGDTIATKYAIGNAKLKYAELKTGSIKVKLTNTIDKPIVFTYHLISAQKDGVSFMVTETVGANSIFTKSYSLNGYELDLRGPEQNTFNALSATYSIMIDPNESSPYTFKSGEKFTVENTFQNIFPAYLTGFFGSREVNLSEVVETPLFERYPFDFLDIKYFDLSFTVDNGIGADLELSINEVMANASNSAGDAILEHEMIHDPFQINRASQIYVQENPVKHVQKMFVFNDANSNLDELVESAPHSMRFDLDVSLNPFGNISLGNDFAFYGHDLSVTMNGSLPFVFGLGGLHLRDTIDYSFNVSSNDSVYIERLNHGWLKVVFDNAFPIEAATQLYLINDEGVVIDSVLEQRTTLSGAQNGNAQSEFRIPLNQEKRINLEAASRIVTDAYLSTPDGNVVSVSNENKLSFKLVAEINADL